MGVVVVFGGFILFFAILLAIGEFFFGSGMTEEERQAFLDKEF